MRNVKIDVSSAVITRGRQSTAADGLLVGSRILAVISPSASVRPGVLPPEAVSIDPDEGTIIGPLTSITATAVTLDGQTIAVDASTLFNGYWNQKPIHSRSEIAAGVPVSVEVASLSGGLLALEVHVLGPPSLPPPVPALDETSITGVVAAIAQQQWTVGTTQSTSPRASGAESGRVLEVDGSLSVVRGSEEEGDEATTAFKHVRREPDGKPEV